MINGHIGDRISLNLIILKSAALLVPCGFREEWSTEWTSELWYVLQGCHGRQSALAFCLGAFQDALWLRHNQASQVCRAQGRLQSH